MFHVVYLSFEDNSIGRDYVGKHSSENPYDSYLGSFKDESFHPTNKIILEYSRTAEGALAAEMRWQRVFKVVEDPQFVNQSYQTSTKFLYSEGLFGPENPMFGKSGKLNPNFGNDYSDEAREKIAKAREGTKAYHNPDTGELIWRRSHPGDGWMPGFPDQVKISQSLGKTETNKGKKTFHHKETGETRMFHSPPDENWMPGQHPDTIAKKANSHRGKKRNPQAIRNMQKAQQKRYAG